MASFKRPPQIQDALEANTEVIKVRYRIKNALSVYCKGQVALARSLHIRTSQLGTKREGYSVRRRSRKEKRIQQLWKTLKLLFRSLIG